MAAVVRTCILLLVLVAPRAVALLDLQPAAAWWQKPSMAVSTVTNSRTLALEDTVSGIARRMPLSLHCPRSSKSQRQQPLVAMTLLQSLPAFNIMQDIEASDVRQTHGIRMELGSDDDRDRQALLPFLIQIVPIGFFILVGRELLPAIAPPLALLALIIFLVVSAPPDDDGL